MAVFSFLKKITGSVLDAYPELRDARTWDQHVAAGLRLELERCPICAGDFTNHWFACFASSRIGHKCPPVQPFLDAVKNHQWEKALKYQNGEEIPDNAEVCALKCASGNLALLFVHTPFEPWDYQSIDFRELLDAHETAMLKPWISADKWRPLGNQI